MISFIKEIINKNLCYENKLLKKYGYADKLKKYNVKVIFLSDTHGCLKYDKNIIEYMKNIPEYDLCILLGDHSNDDIETILQIIPKNKIYALPGNHDSIDKYKQYNIYDINGKVINIKDIKIAGIGGSYRYKNIEDYALYTHEESIEIANKMEKADILVSHDKAFIYDNHNPSHDGLKGITQYIYTNHIPLHVHGHIHENYKTKLKNNTESICIYKIKYLEL